MGKKKMVMRRIAALLIASLVVTSSAFMSLAETPSSSGGGSGTIQDKYYDLVQPNDVTLKVGETKTITLESTEATKSNVIYATDSNALLDGAKWQSSSTNVTVSGTGKTVTLKGERVGEATVSVQSTGTNADGQNFESSVVRFKVTVSASETPTKISMDETLSVKVGEEKEIIPVVTGATDGYTIDWSSNNTSIATVENGKVTGVSAGTAIITAKIGDASATCTVTVSESEQETKYELKLDKTTLDLEVGNSEKLTATVTQNGTPVKADVVWSVFKNKEDDGDIVSVTQDGMVTAVSKGEAKVIARATVSNKSVGEATCTVTVTEKEVPENPVFALQLDKENVKLILGEGATLAAKVTKDGEEVKDVKIDWTLEGKNIGTIVDGKITSTALGRAFAVATAKVGDETLRAECEVIVVPKLAIDKQTLTMFEGATAKINVTELSEGADIEKWYIGDEEAITSEVIEKVGSDTEKTFTIKALKAGKEVVTVWAAVKLDNGEFHFFNSAECAIEVLPVPVQTVVEDIEVPEISATEEEKYAEVFEDVEKAKDSIEKQTTKIQEAVTAAVKEAVIEPAEDIKEIFKNIEEIPEDSEVKLLSVKAAVAVEKDKDGNPIKDENGNPVVVVQKLTYHISVVTSEGKVVPHSALENNETLISIDVPLPAQGIKDEWRFAEIKHYADEECTDLINTLYSRIYGSGDSKYITIKTTKFSPFVMEFSVESKEPVATPSRPSSSGGSSGGGSRRHVVGGGGSSTNSYSMTGNWVMGANGWTFVKSDGQTAANTWGWINGQYYYFDANGNMMTGWQFINGKWYYLNPAEGSLQGAMLSGVLYDPAYNAYFYADASGAMVTGWYQVGANWYYFSPVNDGVHVTGQLLAGTYVDGYYLGADGAWVPGN